MLTESRDGFGQMIRDYWNGKTVQEIIERDDGYISTSNGPTNYFASFEAWPAHQQQAIRQACGRVLDIGCGAGRVALYLQSLGLEVVAIDNSALALEVCRERGVKDTRQLSITQVSSRLGQFDTIVMLGNNFGLFGNPRRMRWLLARFSAITPPNARIIAETTDIYQTEDPDHLSYHEYNRRRGRLAGQLRIRVRYRKLAGPWFEYLFLSPTELETQLAGSGWQIYGLEKAISAPQYVAILGKAQP